jgi:hypothetical protein
MKYQLEKTTGPGVVIRVQDFDGEPPTLAPEKGLVWLPYVAPVPPAPPPEQIKYQLTWAVQRHLDTKARERNYDNIVSACSYAAAANPFQDEGLAFLGWRSMVWAYCYQVLADVEAQLRPVPTEAELLAELPELVLP